MELTLEIKKMPKKGDILIFNGKSFEPVDKEHYLNQQNIKIKKLEEEINENKEEFISYKGKINEKLREFHKILQTLTDKGE